MPLNKCSECQKEISNQTTTYTNCGHRIKKAKRTIMGKIIKYLFIIFNILILIWLISYFVEAGKIIDKTINE